MAVTSVNKVDDAELYNVVVFDGIGTMRVAICPKWPKMPKMLPKSKISYEKEWVMKKHTQIFVEVE